MNILYIGDGRKGLNWGAQATSTALHDLIAEQETMQMTIPTQEFYRFYPSSFLLARLIGNPSRKTPFIQFYNWLSKKGYHFINQDINGSFERFMVLKESIPELEAMYTKIQNCDAVVVNAEGAMILNNDPKRSFLYFLLFIKIAKSLGKKAYSLNGMITDYPGAKRNAFLAKEMVDVLKLCDEVSVRDHMSYNILKELAPDLKVTFVPDALFTWVTNPKIKSYWADIKAKKLLPGFSFDKPYICISGGSRARYNLTDAIPAYIQLVNELKKTGLQLFLVPTCKFDAFLTDVSKSTGVPVLPVDMPVQAGAAVVGNARVFVSGRFHPSIMCSLGGTPCVFMGSNSHKNLSLQEVLEYPAPKEYEAIPSPAEIESIINDVNEILKEGEGRRNKISETVSRLSAQSRAGIHKLLRQE